ncbi:MAG TPA: hypothetical protein V6D21_00855, partial [Candidatus Obscuribacterales bacterium]
DPTNPTYNWGGNCLHEVDNILALVRKQSEVMPLLNFYPDHKMQRIRGIYAFSCWVFLDKCQSNEDDYINSLLG